MCSCLRSASVRNAMAKAFRCCDGIGFHLQNTQSRRGCVTLIC